MRDRCSDLDVGGCGGLSGRCRDSAELRHDAVGAGLGGRLHRAPGRFGVRLHGRVSRRSARAHGDEVHVGNLRDLVGAVGYCLCRGGCSALHLLFILRGVNGKRGLLGGRLVKPVHGPVQVIDRSLAFLRASKKAGEEAHDAVDAVGQPAHHLSKHLGDDPENVPDNGQHRADRLKDRGNRAKELRDRRQEGFCDLLNEWDKGLDDRRVERAQDVNQGRHDRLCYHAHHGRQGWKDCLRELAEHLDQG